MKHSFVSLSEKNEHATEPLQAEEDLPHPMATENQPYRIERDKHLNIKKITNLTLQKRPNNTKTAENTMAFQANTNIQKRLAEIDRLTLTEGSCFSVLADLWS
jgi:hypothetical protein